MDDCRRSEIIPDGWTFISKLKGGFFGSYYLCPATGQHFYTYEDLMRYVNYAKQAQLSIYAPDFLDSKIKGKKIAALRVRKCSSKCLGAKLGKRRGLPRRRRKGNCQGALKQLSLAKPLQSSTGEKSATKRRNKTCPEDQIKISDLAMGRKIPPRRKAQAVKWLTSGQSSKSMSVNGCTGMMEQNFTEGHSGSEHALPDWNSPMREVPCQEQKVDSRPALGQLAIDQTEVVKSTIGGMFPCERREETSARAFEQHLMDNFGALKLAVSEEIPPESQPMPLDQLPLDQCMIPVPLDEEFVLPDWCLSDTNFDWVFDPRSISHQPKCQPVRPHTLSLFDNSIQHSAEPISQSLLTYQRRRNKRNCSAAPSLSEQNLKNCL